jgi:flagellar hook-basal body complex protein FliE
MTVNVGTAINAYLDTARGARPGMEPREAPAGASFADMLGKLGDDALAAGEKADRMSVAGIEGTADIAEVVTAVANAELALQTVVAVRDQVVAAYQEIMRMPI